MQKFLTFDAPTEYRYMEFKLEYNENGLVKVPSDRQLADETLFFIYAELDKGTHRERILNVEKRTGLHQSVIYRRSNKQKWQVRLAAVLVDRGEQQVYADTESKFADEGAVPKNTDVGFNKIADDIKGFTFMMLTASRRVVEVNATMLEYFTEKVDLLVRQKMIRKLTVAEEAQLEKLVDKLNKCERSIREYMKPASISRYLTLIGIEDAIEPLPDDIEMGAFTPARLLRAIEEHGVGTIVGDEKYLQLMKESIADVLILPDIDARRVVDEQNRINSN